MSLLEKTLCLLAGQGYPCSKQAVQRAIWRETKRAQRSYNISTRQTEYSPIYIANYLTINKIH